MDDALLSLVLERLDHDPLPEPATDLLLAACESDFQLADALGGSPVARPGPLTPSADGGEPAGAYLTSVTVSGFRGIGAPAVLPIPPGPGLTLVLGRNGSGKSSFAEGLELLLTGRLRRWDDRGAVWREGWRNLHHGGGAVISAELLLEGKGSATVERHWKPEASLDGGEASVQVAGERRSALETLGWTADLIAYRPFLCHAELETFLGKPSELHDLLAGVLGLEDLVTTANRLAKARTNRESSLTAAKKDLTVVLQQLAGVDDERARTATKALAGKKWDLPSARAVVSGIPGVADDSGLTWLRRLAQLSVPAEGVVLGAAGALRAAADRLDVVAGSESTRSRDLAALLRAALARHAGGTDVDCPVCGRPGALDDSWHQRTEAGSAATRHGRRRGRRSGSGGEGSGRPRPGARFCDPAGVDDITDPRRGPCYRGPTMGGAGAAPLKASTPTQSGPWPHISNKPGHRWRQRSRLLLAERPRSSPNGRIAGLPSPRPSPPGATPPPMRSRPPSPSPP